jgi:allantoate deiminase
LSRAEQVVARCRELAFITDVEDEITRTYLSDAMRRANELVATWMQDAGLTVSMDATGNLRGVQTAHNATSKHVVIASHLDTVPNAGAFDGVLGVLMGIAIAQELRDTQLPFSLEIIAFSEEEGVRFGVPFIGSRAFAGTLDDALLARIDKNGISVRNAIQNYGLDETKLPEAKHGDVLAYLECHIEQGPVLESEGLPLGVVESIAGQSRYHVHFHGHANHAGTTPMNLRQDAMSAAAEWIAKVEGYAKSTPGLVATVGSVQTIPGAGNVIAGSVHATLDVRSSLDTVRNDATEHLLLCAKNCGEKRGVKVTSSTQMQQNAVPMDRDLLRLLEDAVDGTGCLVRRMVSGAGHDAMIVAPHIPAAMLFLRTPGGLSHHPDEAVGTGDVQLGLDVGIAFVKALAQREANR